MRDILILAIVLAGSAAALKRPWIGILLWNWLSIMNPHRYAFGIAFNAPVAAMAAACTLIGLFVTKDRRESPIKTAAMGFFVFFVVWMNLSWVLGLDPAGDYNQWNKVMKIDLMIIVAMVLLHNKQHIFGLAWVTIGSMMLLGVKGGQFTILGGGNERVWGPPGSFIEDNNEFGLALIMTIPMIRFLQMQVQHKWGKWALTGAMLLCAAAVFGTHSRGAFLAIFAMGAIFWWRSGKRVLGGIVIVVAAIALLSFMPEKWVDRMNSIGNYEQDGSAQGRLGAWSASWNMAFHYPTGVGYNQVRQDLFDRFSHKPEVGARAAHSIYFQILGNHGFVGLFLFVGIWFATWWNASWLRRNAIRCSPEAKWCADLGSMTQVALVGYLVGGSFLSLAYFDLPYNLMMLAALARVWVMKEGWKTEPVYQPGWKTIPGLAVAPSK